MTIEEIKNRIQFLHDICWIKEELGHIIVGYIEFNPYKIGNSDPFSRKSHRFELSKIDIRDSAIDEILKFGEKVGDSDIESIIYTEDQRDKIEKLRNKKMEDKRSDDMLKSARKKYSESFRLGQRVWYKNTPGIITFKHEDKDVSEPTKWTVNLKDIEYRYVSGVELKDRPKENLSHIKIDPELNKLSTEKLLKMLKRSQKENKGKGNILIKRILQDREHIKKGETKIVVVK